MSRKADEIRRKIYIDAYLGLSHKPWEPGNLELTTEDRLLGLQEVARIVPRTLDAQSTHQQIISANSHNLINTVEVTDVTLLFMMYGTKES